MFQHRKDAQLVCFTSGQLYDTILKAQIYFRHESEVVSYSHRLYLTNLTDFH
jgi:hypothetical protein